MASFIEAVLKCKVATICDHVGYNAITRESSNILVDLYRRTIIHLARHCKEAANNNRRVEPTLIDLVQAYNFVGISIPELQEHAETVKIPFNVKLEDHEDIKPSNRIQRDLFIDDLLDAEKNVTQADDNDDGPENKALSDVDEAEKNMAPLLTDIYKEAISFPNPIAPIKADIRIKREEKLINPIEPIIADTKIKPEEKPIKPIEPIKADIKIKREEKPIIPKLKIKPLDPSVAEPPSFLPILKKTDTDGNQLVASVCLGEPKPPKQKKKKRSSNQFAIVTETVSAAAEDEEEWLCPTCNGPDNGNLMVGCDTCDLWYHLRCTNLKKPPKDDENWSCSRCVKTEKKTPTPTLLPQATTSSASTSKSQSKGRKRHPPKLPIKSSKTPELKTCESPTPPLKVSMNESSVPCMSQDDLCPECQLPDDGTLMIQCDDPFCARWFHGKCVSVLEEPKDDESWFCKVCVDKQQSAFKRRRRI